MDADELHTPHNIDKMRRGEPLDDADREPWLTRVCCRLETAMRMQERLVLACSALKRVYRQRFWATAPELRLIYLKADQAVLARRLVQRRGHFMSASLLDSQLLALQEPSLQEPVLIVDASLVLETEVQRVLDWLRVATP